MKDNDEFSHFLRLRPTQSSSRCILINWMILLSNQFLFIYLLIFHIPAAKMAADAINKNESVLPEYDLKMHAYDGQCRTDKVMKSFIDYIRLPSFPYMAGILGKCSYKTLYG